MRWVRGCGCLKRRRLIRETNLGTLRSKEYDDISDIMVALKDMRHAAYTEVPHVNQLERSATPEEKQAIKTYRLEAAKTLLASTTFNGQMNALKEARLERHVQAIYILVPDPSPVHGRL